MGRGLAEVEPNMVNPSGPLPNFSKKCYENSVPNHAVLVKSLQHSEELRKCVEILVAYSIDGPDFGDPGQIVSLYGRRPQTVK